MNGWINGLTVYNVHVMFEISAKTIYERNNCIKTYERYAFLYDPTQKIYCTLVITRNNQHYHVNIVHSRKIYPSL
jgi:hypothetical protein